jgi:transcriptional regulator with XRE-family HTH domain
MPADEDFAAVLRRFRERLTPDRAGIVGSPPAVRRVTGLRRAELAAAAGISEDHLRRLEQGRRRPSPGVVDALAAALRLDRAAHGLLRELAGFAAPGRSGERVPDVVTPVAQRMLDRLVGVPACVCDAMWTVLAGNFRWNAYVCTSGATRERERNMAWRMFTGAPTEVFRTPERTAAFRASLVADLRAAAHRYRADARLHTLIADLRERSDAFARLWELPPTLSPDVDRLRVSRPGHHDVELDRDVLTVPDGDLRVVIFTAP